MDKLRLIRENKEFNTLLMKECDIYFYSKTKETQFCENNEEYSLDCKAFAQDGSGGEYAFLEDESIGFIGSEGDVGRVAESLDDLLIFLIHTGCISDFNCKYIYYNKELLRAFCKGYVSNIRDSYKVKGDDWDKIRGNIAKMSELNFTPDKLEEITMNFFKAATRQPLFTCKYGDGEDEYMCDSVLSDIVGSRTVGLVGMSKEEIEMMVN